MNNIHYIAECWCKIDCTSEGSKLNYAIYRCNIFPDGSVCLCHMWKGQSYVNGNVSVPSIFNSGHLFLKNYLLRHRNSTRRDSSKYQLLRLYSQFSFTKILEPLQVLIFTAFWRNVPFWRSALLEMFLCWCQQTIITETSSRRHFPACFSKCISITMFFQYRL